MSIFTAINRVNGRLVRTLVDKWQAPGEKTVTWNGRNQQGRNVATGIYLYRLKSSDFSVMRKMLLIR